MWKSPQSRSVLVWGIFFLVKAKALVLWDSCTYLACSALSRSIRRLLMMFGSGGHQVKPSWGRPFWGVFRICICHCCNSWSHPLVIHSFWLMFLQELPPVKCSLCYRLQHKPEHLKRVILSRNTGSFLLQTYHCSLWSRGLMKVHGTYQNASALFWCSLMPGDKNGVNDICHLLHSLKLSRVVQNTGMIRCCDGTNISVPTPGMNAACCIFSRPHPDSTTIAGTFWIAESKTRIIASWWQGASRGLFFNVIF